MKRKGSPRSPPVFCWAAGLPHVKRAKTASAPVPIPAPAPANPDRKRSLVRLSSSVPLGSGVDCRPSRTKRPRTGAGRLEGVSTAELVCELDVRLRMCATPQAKRDLLATLAHLRVKYDSSMFSHYVS